MLLLLKIVAGFLIAILALIALGFIAVRVYLKRYCNEISSNTRQALSIHLHEDLSAEWLNETEAKSCIAQFEELQFSTGKAYRIEGMDQVECLSLFHERYVGVLYKVENMGYFFDIMHTNTDNISVTVTTMPFAETFESPPSKKKIYIADGTIKNTFETISERCQNEQTKPVIPEDFRDSVENYYKEEQAYRNRNGGVQFSEFKSVAESEKKRYSEDQIRTAFIEHKTEELELWTEAGVSEYFEKNNISEEERYCSHGYLIVPSKTDAESFVHYLNQYDLVHDDHVSKVGSSVREDSDIIQLFNRINNARSPALRAAECGSVVFPVEAKVYKLAS